MTHPTPIAGPIVISRDTGIAALFTTQFARRLIGGQGRPLRERSHDHVEREPERPTSWACALYFHGNGPHWITLVDNGAVQNAGTSAIALPETYIVDKIYFPVQSQDASQPHDLDSLITKESDINWGYAKNWQFRYDSYEVTLQDGPIDVGNLTSVNGFVLPMALSVDYGDDTTGMRGYDIPASEFFNTVSAMSDSKSVYT